MTVKVEIKPPSDEDIARAMKVEQRKDLIQLQAFIREQLKKTRKAEKHLSLMDRFISKHVKGE